MDTIQLPTEEETTTAIKRANAKLMIKKIVIPIVVAVAVHVAVDILVKKLDKN